MVLVLKEYKNKKGELAIQKLSYDEIMDRSDGVERNGVDYKYYSSSVGYRPKGFKEELERSRQDEAKWPEAIGVHTMIILEVDEKGFLRCKNLNTDQEHYIQPYDYRSRDLSDLEIKDLNKIMSGRKIEFDHYDSEGNNNIGRVRILRKDGKYVDYARKMIKDEYGIYEMGNNSNYINEVKRSNPLVARVNSIPYKRGSKLRPTH